MSTTYAGICEHSSQAPPAEQVVPDGNETASIGAGQPVAHEDGG